MPAWYATAKHGDLCSTRSLFPAIAELLLNGNATRLPRQPGQRDIAPADMAPPTAVDETLPIFPDQRQLLAMAIGGKPPSLREEPEPQPAVRVRMVHGDLAHARQPRHRIPVGHSVGDPISSSEAALDRKLNGRLTRRNARGLHPGLIGTWGVHLTDPDRRRPAPDIQADAPASPGETGSSMPQRLEGAMVAGLEVISTLSAGALTRTIRNALLAYVDAAEQMGWPRDRLLAFSTVLLGSGGGAVSVGDCVAEILNATEEVNGLIAGEQDKEDQTSARVEAQVPVVSGWTRRLRPIDPPPGGQSATLPVQSLQQCLALPLRLKPAAGELADPPQALQILAALDLACGAGIPRLDIMAGQHQRIAILSPANRSKALKKMAVNLEQAALLAGERDAQPEPLRLRLPLARALQNAATTPPDPALMAEARLLALHLPGAPPLALVYAEPLCDSEAMGRFTGIGPGNDRIPDETTILNLRHLPVAGGPLEAALGVQSRHLVGRI